MATMAEAKGIKEERAWARCGTQVGIDKNHFDLTSPPPPLKSKNSFLFLSPFQGREEVQVKRRREPVFRSAKTMTTTSIHVVAVRAVVERAQQRERERDLSPHARESIAVISRSQRKGRRNDEWHPAF